MNMTRSNAKLQQEEKSVFVRRDSRMRSHTVSVWETSHDQQLMIAADQPAKVFRFLPSFMPTLFVCLCYRPS